MSLIVVITFLAAAVVGYTARAARNSRRLDERLAARYASRRRERAELGIPDGGAYSTDYAADGMLVGRADDVLQAVGPRYTPDTIATARRAVRPSFGIQMRVRP